MLIIPAVDIKGGRAVRLIQGKADQETVYDHDPVRAAHRWADLGARRIHIVDLDGAFEGAPKNIDAILDIVKECKNIELEIGGGLRSSEAVARLIDAGAARCVIGTKVVEDRPFLRAIAERYPGKISVGLDAKGGLLVTKGWVTVSDVLAVDLVAELYTLPLAEVIYTDIERDGMLQGPNLKRLQEMKAASHFPLIASGGVTTLQNIRDLKAMGCYGAIVGKALFDGRISLEDALACAAE